MTHYLGMNPCGGEIPPMIDQDSYYDWYPSPPRDVPSQSLYSQHSTTDVRRSMEMSLNEKLMYMQHSMQLSTRPMEQHYYTTPSTSPDPVQNYNGRMDNYQTVTGSHWPTTMNYREGSRSPSSYSTGSEVSHPNPLSSPNARPVGYNMVELTQYLLRQQASFNSVNPPMIPFGIPILNEDGTLYSSNSHYQQPPSPNSPSIRQTSSPAKKLAVQKQKRQRKKTKKQLKEMELLRQNSLAGSTPEPLFQDGGFQKSPVYPSSLTENCLQEQVNPSDFCQIYINSPDSHFTNQGPKSPSETSTISEKSTAKKPRPIKPFKKLTEAVYRSNPAYMVPRYDPQGRIKKHKCKKTISGKIKCGRLFNTKHDLWIHFRVHYASKRMYECPESYCSFVSLHNHHYLYHESLHKGERKFFCSQCDYSGPNKATLKSHEKIHANFHHYTCNDCDGKFKYMHTLKKHLRKLTHLPGRSFDNDGNEIFGLVIDINGRKRGPRRKQNNENKKNNQNSPPSNQNSPPSNQNQQPTDDINSISNGLLSYTLLKENLVETQNLGRIDAQMGTISPIAQHYLMMASNVSLLQHAPTNLNGEVPLDLSVSAAKHIFPNETAAVADSIKIPSPKVEEAQVLNLSTKKPKKTKPSTNGRRTGTNKRKGKAVKYVCPEKQYEMSDHEDANNNNAVIPKAQNNSTPISTNRYDEFKCEYCQVSFGQLIMFSDHMRYHNQNDPSACDICKKRFNNQAEFYFHISRENHSQYPQ